MCTITRLKAAAVSVVAATASLSAIGVPALGHTAAARTVTAAVAEQSICIPCLEPCGPVCFFSSAPVQEALRSAAGSTEIARLD